MTYPVWKMAGVSVPGFSHLAEGTGCQDAHRIVCTGGGWFVGIVSDGAGSARHGAAGSAMASHMLAMFLAERLMDLQDAGAWVADVSELTPWVKEGIALLRERLALTAARDQGTLEDYHATIVGTVAGPSGGIFFHIGDGAAVALAPTASAAPVLSRPENGEFSETTFFLTQSQWEEHLRITTFGPEHDVLLMMTDGVTPFALTRDGAGPFAPFVEPLTKYLRENSRPEGEAALAATLSKEEVRRITGDDKTLVWAMRNGAHE